MAPSRGRTDWGAESVTTTEPTLATELEPSIRPQDDLFGHVNARWLATAEIPDDRPTWGVAVMLVEQAEVDVRTIIEEAASSNAPAGSDERKIGDLYRSFMNEDAIEAAGAAPLHELFARIGRVGDRDELVRLMGELVRDGVAGPIGVHATLDRGDPTRNILLLFQSGLGLPDESYYRMDEYAEIRAAYRSYLAAMVRLAGLAADDAESADYADTVIGFETRLASAHWERAATRDVVKTYNLTASDALCAALPQARVWFDGMGVATEAWGEVVVMQPDVLTAVAEMLRDVDLDVWKRWLSTKVLSAFAPYLSSAFVDEHFAFYGRTLTGAPRLKERWKRAVSLVEGALGEAVGRLYVERHYPASAAAQMNALVANLIEAYRARISNLDWMEDETRKRALAKLEAFRPKVGHPVKWRDYSALAISSDDLFGNVVRSNAFDFAREVAKLSEPVDRDEWFMTPQTVNAYYHPTMNEIVFPAAILQPPFFDPDGDPAYNYGAIGAVIGHEIGHGFDDQGSRFDGDGTLRDWWTAEDRARFDVKVKALVEQYSAFSPRDLEAEHTVNGAFTVGENIGDLGGVTVAHHAYRLSLGGKDAPVVDGLTGDQRFFVGWARAWRAIIRREEAIRRLAIDPHSPAEFRANVVRNIDAFHEAFATAPGDELWLAEEDRVRIW